MTIQTQTLRPGLLVGLKTSVTGNVSYRKINLEAETEGNVSTAKWETIRTIVDPAEHERAKQARNKAGSKIRSVCINSAFGLLCPEGDRPRLDAALEEARQIVNEFNLSSKISTISLYVITGRVSPDDVEALKSINSEVRELMGEMERGLKDLDVKAIREAAAKAKEVGSMLSADYEAKVQIAVDTARGAATRIAAAKGQATGVDQAAVNKIVDMRRSFLDMDDSEAVKAPAAKGRTLDLAGTE